MRALVSAIRLRRLPDIHATAGAPTGMPALRGRTRDDGSPDLERPSLERPSLERPDLERNVVVEVGLAAARGRPPAATAAARRRPARIVIHPAAAGIAAPAPAPAVEHGERP